MFELIKRGELPSYRVGRKVRGYENEALSNLAVASTVARGEADVAVGNEKVALQVQDVEFIPLQKERYELII